MRMMVKATAFHAPPRIETAEEVATLVGKSAEWIRLRTGVDRRRRCEEPLEVLASRPAMQALRVGPKTLRSIT